MKMLNLKMTIFLMVSALMTAGCNLGVSTTDPGKFPIGNDNPPITLDPDDDTDPTPTPTPAPPREFASVSGDLGLNLYGTSSFVPMPAMTGALVWEHVPIPNEVMNKTARLVDKAGSTVIEEPDYYPVSAIPVGKKIYMVSVYDDGSGINQYLLRVNDLDAGTITTLNEVDGTFNLLLASEGRVYASGTIAGNSSPNTYVIDPADDSVTGLFLNSAMNHQFIKTYAMTQEPMGNQAILKLADNRYLIAMVNVSGGPSLYSLHLATFYPSTNPDFTQIGESTSGVLDADKVIYLDTDDGEFFVYNRGRKIRVTDTLSGGANDTELTELPGGYSTIKLLKGSDKVHVVATNFSSTMVQSIDEELTLSAPHTFGTNLTLRGSLISDDRVYVVLDAGASGDPNQVCMVDTDDSLHCTDLAPGDDYSLIYGHKLIAVDGKVYATTLEYSDGSFPNTVRIYEVQLDADTGIALGDAATGALFERLYVEVTKRAEGVIDGTTFVVAQDFTNIDDEDLTLFEVLAPDDGSGPM